MVATHGNPSPNPRHQRERRIVAYLTNNDAQRVDRLADEAGVSRSAIVCQLLRQALSDIAAETASA